ncbi:MAG: 3-dehydroquinate synthase [Chloroflexota bacterium]|nr:3-dehydroquinate synthase [Chloroflexota bacterium]
MISRVALVGLSGTGKSSAARLIAEALGWTVVDTDHEVESRARSSIPDIFRRQGESAFRMLERTAMREALARSAVVIATGGGAVLDEEIWAEQWLGAPGTLVVRFDADPTVLLGRLRRQAESGARDADRPLLAGADPLASLERMRRQREHAYAQADVTLDVTSRALSDAVAAVVELVHLGSGQASTVELDLPHASSLISVGPGTRLTLGDGIARRWPAADRVWIGIDEHVAPHVADVIDAEALRRRFDVRTTVIPSGETSKRLAGLSALYDWMLEGSVRRGDVAVALGGGMVGDLMGYAAATVLRGIGLVQIPTTLLSMVDSSVGGKTGINHPAGKNLIGAFYQPSRVLVDPDLLRSLPEREFRSGWAEIIKHAVIEPSTPGGQDGRLLTTLERNAPALLERRIPVLPWVIRLNIAIKTAVVEADERESSLRAVLNFGHTIGHAIEAAGYQLLHGEAVAVGMRAALIIGEGMDLIDAERVDRITSLITAFGLPTSASFDMETVRSRMMSDKKITEVRQTWILPVREGGVIMSRDVPDAVVDDALASVLMRS